MIKELKVNLYRLIRSKFFAVITIIMLVISVFTALEIKMCVDDPLGIISNFKEGYQLGLSIANDENESEDQDDSIVDYAIASDSDDEDSDSIIVYIEMFQSCNSLDGVLRVLYYENFVFLLVAIIAALFVGAEYKSRFHMHRYSVNVSPRSIVCGEIFSLVVAAILIEVLSYAVALGITYLLCNSFRVGNVLQFLRDYSLIFYATIMFVSFAYMIAYIRRSSALAIVFSVLLFVGVFDLVFLFASYWYAPLKYFALSSIMGNLIMSSSMSPKDWVYTLGSLTIYIVSFISTTLIVASKRDAY